MRTTTLVAAAMLVTVVAVAPAASADSGDYIAGTGDARIVCDTEAVLGACLGGQIFDVGSGDSVDVSIDDDNVANVGGFYQFADQNDEVLDSGGFCSDTSVSVPSGAVSLAVFVDTGFGPLDCPANPPGFASTGTITADFFTPV